LEENRPAEAAEAISRLHALAPGRPEPLLLERLLAQRRALLAPNWGRAFLDAWAELGRPDLRDSPLLPPALHSQVEATALVAQAWQRAPTETRLTLVLVIPSLSHEQARWLIQRIPTLDDVALLLALLDPVRQSLFPEALRSEAQEVLLQRLRHLTEGSSHAMLPRLSLLLAGTHGEVPFDAHELEELEIISTLSTWRDTSFSETFLQARGHLRDSGFPDATARALGVAEQTVGSGMALLARKRAEASWAHLSWDGRRRLGRMLWHIGQRMADASSLQEHSVGTLLMELAADHLEQGCDLPSASARDERVREDLRASLKASVERWPLPSLREELEASRARNELLWLSAFTGRGDLP
jgi:hypothetical protein